jgi:hypothetical protein
MHFADVVDMAGDHARAVSGNDPARASEVCKWRTKEPDRINALPVV